MRLRPARSRPVAAALLLSAALLLGVPAASLASDTSHPALVNPNPADWTPQIQDGQVNAIVQMGTRVVVGGTFTTVRRAGTSQDLTRNYLFAFDMHTGVIDPGFVPQLNGNVLALAPGRTARRCSSGESSAPSTASPTATWCASASPTASR